MRAAVYHGPRDIRVESVPEPGPARGTLVLEVTRAAICGTDSAEWEHGPSLVRPPVTLGHEFAGRVVDVGGEVEGFSVGDRVASGAGVSCGRCEWCLAGRTNLCAAYYTLGLQADGGLAERVRVPASICRRVPPGCDDTAAAMAQPMAVALHAVRRSGVVPGDTCVVIGAGGIGAFIVAAAAAAGVSKLVAVDIDPERLETAGRLGAGVVADATGRELVETILDVTDPPQIVIEASGAPSAPSAALHCARRGGRVTLVGLQSAPRELDVFAATTREVDLVTSLAHVCAVDLPEALDLLARTPLAEVVLDRVVPLESVVEDGIRALAERRAHGKIVVDPAG